jgi:thiol-disulfide isomerase/thioredoxin
MLSVNLSAFLWLTAAFAEPSWHASLAPAVAESRKTGRPILADFQAPWCYSCYYMEQKVLSGAAFAKAAERLVLLKLDVDTPEGRALKEKHKVTFLPTYVVMDADEKPLSRIIGEQTEKDFLDKLKQAAGGPASPDEKSIESLRQRLAAAEYDEAEREIAALPGARKGRLSEQKAWRVLAARLRLMRAAKDGKPGGEAALKELLAEDDSCELAYDAVYGEKFLEPNRDAARAALEKLAEEKIFKGRCADFRTGLEVLAEIYEKQGAKAKREELLLRAIAILDGQGDVGKDRNRDDNLRFFLELAKDDARVRALYPKLARAYETDYVYPYRFARYLLEQKDAKAALSWIEKAEALCYGANRMSVSKVKAKILAALGRKDEAISLLKREIKAGKAFPQDAEALAAELKKLE